MKSMRRGRMTRGRKRLKLRLVLLSLTVCAGTFGVLYAFRGGRDASGDGTVVVRRDGVTTPVAMSGSKIVDGEMVQNMSGRLLSSGSCTHTVDNVGMVVLHIVGVLFCFLGLAIVCDEFFQTSLEIISDVLNLTPDVAGATFLAAGSSAPELFTSLTDAFGAADSTGTGTIVGSAMFNILVIVALSAAVAGKNGSTIAIDWRPVCRDVVFYSYSILLLTLTFLDSQVMWWEGLIMVMSYSGYIVFMKYNSRILAHCQPPRIGITDEPAAGEMAAAIKAVSGARRPSQMAVDDIAKVAPLPQEDQPASDLGDLAAAATEEGDVGVGGADHGDEENAGCRKSTTLGIRNRVERRKSGNLSHGDSFPEGSAILGKTEPKQLVEADKNQPNADEEVGQAGGNKGDVETGPDEAEGGKVHEAGGDAEEEEGDDDRFAWPASLPDQILFVLGLPLLCLLTITIPDCGKPRWRNFYALSFIMSLAWIGTLTHFMVDWVTVVGCYLEVSPIFMGLVVLAVGTSVPDALGSMIAARSGEANMAIANAIGSNVFDILIGLGVPWFLRGLIIGGSMPVNRDGISLNVLILFCTALLFVAVLAINEWSMGTKTGCFLFSLYVAYVILVVVREVL